MYLPDCSPRNAPAAAPVLGHAVTRQSWCCAGSSTARGCGSSPETTRSACPPATTTGSDLRTLGDLGYEGEAGTITVAFKKPKNGKLNLIQQQLNKAHNSLRAIGERGNSLLKMTFKGSCATSPSTPGG
jgi:hypothetical protein